jgi:hypothetical protein
VFNIVGVHIVRVLHVVDEGETVVSDKSPIDGVDHDENLRKVPDRMCGRPFRGTYARGIGEQPTHTDQDATLRDALDYGAILMVKSSPMNRCVRVTVTDMFPTGIRYVCSAQHAYTVPNSELHATMRLPICGDPPQTFNHTQWTVIHADMEVLHGQPAEWTHVFIHRNVRHPDKVCLSFGLGEFRGLDHWDREHDNGKATLHDEKGLKIVYRKRKKTYRNDYR